MFKQLRKSISIVILVAFISTSVRPPAYAQVSVPFMPKPGVMVHLSPEFTPAHLKGMVIYPDNPLKFDFLITKGDETLNSQAKHDTYQKLIKYFLASLAVPDDDQWVNLSPYEKDRIIKDDFGKTEMGRDLLAQDYMLKQITASLIYPEDNLGKRFWDRVYSEAQEKFGTSNVPINTFNKVWIIPDEAYVYEHGNMVYVVSQHLKVMLEEDYLSLSKHSGITNSPNLMAGQAQNPQSKDVNKLGNQIVREIVLPALEKEVNEGKNFAMLRQVYSGMILAAWYKHALKESFLGRIYADKSRLKGVDQDPKNNEVIYKQYLRAFKKGVFNYIKEDVDKKSQETIPRKYFSGGALEPVYWNREGKKGIVRPADLALVSNDPERDNALEVARTEAEELRVVSALDRAMTATETPGQPQPTTTLATVEAVEAPGNAVKSTQPKSAEVTEIEQDWTPKEDVGPRWKTYSDGNTIRFDTPGIEEKTQAWVQHLLQVGITKLITFDKKIKYEIRSKSDGGVVLVQVTRIGRGAEYPLINNQGEWDQENKDAFKSALGIISFSRVDSAMTTRIKTAMPAIQDPQIEAIDTIRANLKIFTQQQGIGLNPIIESTQNGLEGGQNFVIRFWQGTLKESKTDQVDQIKKIGFELANKFGLSPDKDIVDIEIRGDRNPVAVGIRDPLHKSFKYYQGLLGRLDTELLLKRQGIRSRIQDAAMKTEVPPRLVNQVFNELFTRDFRPKEAGGTLTMLEFNRIEKATTAILLDPILMEGINVYQGAELPNAVDHDFEQRKENLNRSLVLAVAHVMRMLIASPFQVRFEDGIHFALDLRCTNFGIKDVAGDITKQMRTSRNKQARTLFSAVVNFFNINQLFQTGSSRPRFFTKAPESKRFEEALKVMGMTPKEIKSASDVWNRTYSLLASQTVQGSTTRVLNPDLTPDDKAMNINKNPSPFGGIDFNAANLNLRIKRDGKGVPLPLSQQDMASLSNLEGLEPVILDIRPATSLPFFSDLQAKQ
jgi:hypothetical protein